MSRYIANYQSMTAKLQEILTLLNTIDIQDIAKEDNKVEFLRYKKNFAILEDIIENLDPELLNNNVSGFVTNAQSSINNLNNFKNNLVHTQYIAEANNYIDAMSSFIRPYILHRKRLKNSLAKAIEEYISSIETHLTDLNEFKDELEQAKSYTGDIKTYHNELLIDGENDSLKTVITTIFEDIESKKTKIYSFYNELLTDDEAVSIQTEISDAKEEIDKTKDEAKVLKNDIEEIFTNSSKTIKELKEFYVDVFGEMDDATEKRVGGLEQEIQTRLSQIDDLETKHNALVAEHTKKYEALEKQINGLLPGATSVGLALEFSSKRGDFNKQTKFWNKFFIGTMAVIFVFGVYLIVKDINIDTAHIFKYSPLYISVVWLALFASKRRNESMRLEQEYLHKETLAKSYTSYKEQIESLGEEEKNQLLQKLLESTTATISQNPNHVLDKNTTEHHPAMEIFSKIWSKK